MSNDAGALRRAVVMMYPASYLWRRLARSRRRFVFRIKRRKLSADLLLHCMRAARACRIGADLIGARVRFAAERMMVMPVGRRLIGVPGAHKQFLLKRPRHELERNRQMFACEAAWQRDCWASGHVEGTSEAQQGVQQVGALSQHGLRAADGAWCLCAGHGAIQSGSRVLL